MYWSVVRRHDLSIGVGHAVAGVRLISDHRLGHLGVVAVTGQSDASVVVRVDRLAEVDRVLELFAQHFAARVARHLQQKETRVALRKEEVGRAVLVQHLETNASPDIGVGQLKDDE